MNSVKIAEELIKIAKLLNAGDSNFKKFVDLYEKYQKADSGTAQEIRKEVDSLRAGFIEDYVGYVVERLKDMKTDPANVFLGSLDLVIGSELAKKYFNKEYPDMISRFDNISNKRISAKDIFKKAYDKAFGKGVFEQAVKNNKKR